MKGFQILFSPEALEDIEEAVRYYNQQSHGLGNRFLADFDNVYRSIARNPFFAGIRYDKIRCAAFRKFPFSVHYSINESTWWVTIIAVFNTWKAPFW